MNTLKYSILLVLIFLTRRVLTKGSPGKFVCLYYGHGQKICDSKTIKPSKMPEECTSFLLFSLDIDRIDPSLPEPDVSIMMTTNPLIDKAWKSGKSVYIVASHTSDDNFKYDAADIEEKGKRDSKALAFLKKVQPNLSGIIIADLTYSDYKDRKAMAAGFKKYLQNVKTLIPDISFGIGLTAKPIVDDFSSGKGGFTFDEFESELDLIIISYCVFNKCTPDLIKGGTAPLEGDKPYTLKKLKDACDKAKIKKEKLYFQYQIFAISDRTSYLTDHNICFSSVGRMCRHEPETKRWCADTSASLKAKGAFAKLNANGMVIDTIDLNDPDEDCKCGSQFPSFYFLLDGWNGKDEHPVCPLFDRPDVNGDC